MVDSPPLHAADAARRHWRATRRLTLLLLAVWFGVSFGVSFFARELDFRFFGWPFSFWMAAQGGGMVFIVIIAVYAHRMDAIDRGVATEPDEPRA